MLSIDGYGKWNTFLDRRFLLIVVLEMPKQVAMESELFDASILVFSVRDELVDPLLILWDSTIELGNDYTVAGDPRQRSSDVAGHDCALVATLGVM